MTKSSLTETIFDALFINEKRTTSKKLEIADIRGWLTPVKDAWANRVACTKKTCSAEKIQAVQQFYKASESGFTWVVDERQVEEKLPEQLIACGFHPARFHQVAGMALQGVSRATNTCHGVDLDIQEVDQDVIDSQMDAVIRASGVNNDQYVRLIMSRDDNITTIVYFAYENNKEGPIGYAKSCFLENGRVHMLLGAAVLPEYRNQGIYSALLQHRIEVAERQGVTTHIIQSQRNSSFSTCARFGFREVSSLELYEWHPNS